MNVSPRPGRSWMLSRSLAALALLAMISPMQVEEAEAQEVTTVLVVRHAEKEWEDGDPPLSDEGRERALDLLRLTEATGVSALYASQYRRTRETLEPVAARNGLEIQEHDAGDPAGLAARILSEQAGGVVLVAGHSNTVPSIVEALGAPRPSPIPDHEYDNLYVVYVEPAGRDPTVLRLSFGRESVAPVATPR